MGKVKEALGYPDVTEFKDVFSPPESTVPTETEHALYELWRSSKILLDNANQLTVGDLKDLTEVMGNLQDTIHHVRKPF